MTNKFDSLLKATLLATFLAGSICASAVLARLGETSQGSAGSQDSASQRTQTNTTIPPAKAQSPTSSAQPSTAAHPSRFQPDRFAARAGKYYQLVWGVDSLSVKTVESGEMIRFAYQVLDPNKAKMLNDKKFAPALIDPQAGVSLVVPAMEQVGILRQSAPPEAGKFYWMAFSNSGMHVKRGDRVNVVIGQFRADGLVVD
jgi:hypothetical protein